MTLVTHRANCAGGRHNNKTTARLRSRALHVPCIFATILLLILFR